MPRRGAWGVGWPSAEGKGHLVGGSLEPFAEAPGLLVARALILFPSPTYAASTSAAAASAAGAFSILATVGKGGFGELMIARHVLLRLVGLCHGAHLSAPNRASSGSLGSHPRARHSVSHAQLPPTTGRMSLPTRQAFHAEQATHLPRSREQSRAAPLARSHCRLKSSPCRRRHRPLRPPQAARPACTYRAPYWTTSAPHHGSTPHAARCMPGRREGGGRRPAPRRSDSFTPYSLPPY